ncbi:MAG TPA: phenylglyoxylate dehydrogenase, partial [Clostridiales bacterium]|nr:phenylglyoxylate dehydrogenase [Clostridiales bacterium]
MQKFDVMNGNMAAATGAALACPDVIAAYPITPQTPVVEYLTQFVADGVLKSAMSEVESELTAMSMVTGASLAGARTFTATSSQGLFLMFEPYFRASTLRLPIVMAIVNREMISPQTVWGGPQDSITV